MSIENPDRTSLSSDDEAARVLSNREDRQPESEEHRWPDFPIVGIGASAGGLEALQEYFRQVPESTEAAYVVVMHLSPESKSLLPQLLARQANIPIVAAEDGSQVKPGHGYVIPEDVNLTLDGLKMRLVPQRRETNRGLRLPIDLFFKSMAQHFGPQSTAVILSGTGSDGSRGMREVVEAGGMCFVQSPGTAQFDGMPRSAIAIGLHDAVLRPSEIARVITRIHSVEPIDPLSAPTPVNLEGERAEDAFEEILHEVDRRTQVDLSYYKDNTLSRRIARRMKLRHTSDPVRYLRLLRQDPEEAVALKKDILIGVTSFFRDAEVFDKLTQMSLEQLDASPHDKTPFRVWVPACSTGEEAYSLAIVLDEKLKAAGSQRELMIFATDIDEDAIEIAGRGVYTSAIAADISRERLAQYFTVQDDGYVVSSQLRKRIVFARHDLLRDTPLTRMNMVSCRNFLIYLQGEIQEDAAALLYYALKPGGVMLLGQAETPAKLSRGLIELDRAAKLYRKSEDVPLHQMRPRMAGRKTPQLSNLLGGRKKSRPTGRPRDSAMAYDTLDAAAEAAGLVILLLESDRQVRRVFGDGGGLLRTPRGEVRSDLNSLLSPSLSVAATSAIQRLHQGETNPRVSRLKDDGGDLYDVTAATLGGQYNQQKEDYVVLVIAKQPRVAEEQFAEGTAVNHGEMEQVIRQLENELHQSRTDLHATIEELATSNEEQQSTNEELIASNEELQSTNEELQSVNEELQTVNAEHQAKIAELSDLYADLDNLLTSTEIGTIFLDSELRLRRFTPMVNRWLDIGAQDLGRRVEPFLHPLGKTDLIRLCEQVLLQHEPTHTEVELKDGTWKLIRVTPYSADDKDRSGQHVNGVVVSFFDVTPLKQAQLELRQSRDELEHRVKERTDELMQAKRRLDLALNASDVGVWTYDPESQQQEWDAMTYKVFDRDPADGPLSVEDFLKLVHADDQPRVNDALRHSLESGEPYDVEYRIRDRSGRYRVLNVRGKMEQAEDDSSQRMIGICIDITRLRQAEQAIADRERFAQLNRELENKNKALDEFVYTVSHDLRAPIVTCRGFLDILQKQIEKGQHDAVVRSIEHMQNAVSRMDVSIQRLLELSRIGRTKAKLEWVRTQEVLYAVLDDLEGVMGERACAVEVPKPLADVYAEEELMRRVLQNLITNACKYGCPDHGMPIEITTEESREQITLRVTDRGPGIGKEHQQKIFELFTRLDHDKGPDGTGVGLVIVKRVAELVGGACGVDSEPGQGASFWISFPKPARKS